MVELEKLEKIQRELKSRGVAVETHISTDQYTTVIVKPIEKISSEDLLYIAQEGFEFYVHDAVYGMLILTDRPLQQPEEENGDEQQ